MTNPEPTENISGDTPLDEVTSWDTSTPETPAAKVVDRLGELYWRKTYGGKSAFHCLVRTILSQNTSDTASQPAYDALIDRFDDDDVDFVDTLADADRHDIATEIESAGLYNQKSKTIQHCARRIREDHGDEMAFDGFVSEGEPEEVRCYLLDLPGIGPKTADCVLLFAGGRDGVFPVDTHVHRVSRRLGLVPPSADHERVREHLESAVPASACGFGHTSMIQFGRDYCSARKPACLESLQDCPLSALCDRVGVDTTSGTVIDPAVTTE